MGIGMSYGISERLHWLERRRDVAASVVADNKWYELACVPSCPPDRRIHIRGGIVTPSGRWGLIMVDDFIPDTICDFENQDETQMPLSFTDADYYLGLILCYYGDWAAYRTLGPAYEEPIFDNVIGTEVETATEAEGQIDAFLNGYTQWYYYRVPLCGVVLRNDGNTGVDYAILPVDAVNRGRSYLYRDARSGGGIFP